MRYRGNGSGQQTGWGLVLFGCFWGAHLSIASAQILLPGSAAPGRAEQSLEVPGPLGLPMTPVTPPLAEPPAPVADAAGPSFILNDIEITGNTVLSNAELAPLYQARIGQPVELNDLYAIVNAITSAYRDAGYLLSQAILPPQEVKEGKVRIQIVEGYIAEVKIEGDPAGNEAMVTLYAEKIKNSRPLYLPDMERYLLFMRDLPGMSVQSVLSASPAETGAADLTLLLERKPVNAGLEIDNRGSRYVGRKRWTAYLAENSLLGFSESIRMQYSATSLVEDADELRHALVQGEIPIFSEGAKVGIEYARTRSRPGAELRELEVENEAERLSLYLTQPVIRSRAFNFSVHAKFETNDTATRIADLAITDDDLRVARMGATLDFADGWRGQNNFNLELSHGMSVFDASQKKDPMASRLFGDPTFFKAAASASRLQSIGGGFDLYGSVAGQISNDRLLSSELFGVGGAYYGHAYDSSAITGDHGLGLYLEARYTDRLDWPAAVLYQLYSFYDYGAVWDYDTGLRQSLDSAGIGARFRTDWFLYGDLELAVPVSHKLLSGTDEAPYEDTRLFFRVGAQF